MIYSCVTGSRYSMTASVYLMSTVQNFDTGELERTYSFLEKIKCFASGIAASGKDVPGTFESFNRRGEYSVTDYVRVWSSAPIDKQAVISFVTDSAGTLWTEDNGDPTIFDSNGSVPIVNASGRIVEYLTMLTRSEVQDVTGLE
jgi:hypothetical protein